jgi:Fe-S cluster assembly protein SufD
MLKKQPLNLKAMNNDFQQAFDQLQSAHTNSVLAGMRKNAFDAFNRLGIPTVRHEDWKYTRISGLLNKAYELFSQPTILSANDINALRLPGHENAHELFFINGIFSKELSRIHSNNIIIHSLEEAASNKYKSFVEKHLNHCSHYLKDGINALNTAFMQHGVFIQVLKNKSIQQPVYVYNITDAKAASVLSQPRSLIHIDENAEVQIVETYHTIGASECFTNQVMEIIVEQDANLCYYKIQNETNTASHVSTTHIRQIGKSVVYTVTVSLNGNMLRNNLHVVMEAPFSEAHLYGLYFQNAQSHIDNHTIVDNVAPNCLSNELYKGVLNDNATGVFNGKIFVRQPAQKTNAFQSNKNILLSNNASINTKPQLEIFADDVKCSHGCTVGSLDEEALFYLRSRGIPKEKATALLLQGFVTDILEKIAVKEIRGYVEQLIAERLTSVS